MFALGAHSDDVAFSLGAALLDGRLGDCRPVTVFSHSAYTRRHPAGDATRVTALRKREDRRFFAGVTAGAPLWLDLSDAPLRDLARRGTVFTASILPEELFAVQQALSAVLPPQATLLVPLALGEHLDHRLLCAAACEFRRQGRHRLLFYEDLPYAAFMELGAIDAAVRDRADRLGEALVPRHWASPGFEAAKRRAVAIYASQSDPALADHLLGHAHRVGEGTMPAERVWVPAGDESGARW